MSCWVVRGRWELAYSKTMEYEFVRMGNVNFENMAVALCSAEYGPGGTSFGSGTDGGREWTYEGRLPMPENGLPNEDENVWVGNQWSGYTVIQAKHKARLVGGKPDIDWLLSTVSKEVNDWTGTKKSRSRKPQNFLIITNIRLSSVADRGGIDRVRTAMDEHAAAMNLKGWAVWSADHLSRLLDNHGGIRRTYLGQLVTGDLISTLIRAFEGRNADAMDTITNFAAKELYASRNVRLTRSGSDRDHESLADIGIDLPATERNQPFDDDGEPVTLEVAETVLESGNRPLKVSDGGFCTVLIGGPGQGKSTIGQLICQAYRVALLQGQADELAPSDREVLNGTIAHLKSIGVALPTMLRWPVYIQLSQYSENIFEPGDNSIQAYITDQVNSLGGGSIQKSDINAWLADWPWMVVLDGLDEVPDAHTRARLLSRVQEFVTDAASKRADILILATTRSQGYQQDLDVHKPKELDLAELSQNQALSYGRKLVASRNPGEPRRAQEVYARLEGAAKEQATANLMGSPLQVSIMTSLLEDRVRVPSTRYKLFAEFYETVFRREANKWGRLGAKVERHKTDIDKLHDGAGIQLHVASEKSGQADVHLSKEDVKGIARDHLVNVQTYEVPEAEKIANELVDLATDRLVLLVESANDHWGFEVRSFQEFMASRFITEGSDELVLSRLKALGRSSHWRNTWLFAAARVFDARPRLRNGLVDVLREFDDESVADQIVKPGAQLSCDLVMDNFAAEAPGLRRRLLLHCVELLDAPQLPKSIISVLDAAAASDTVVRVAIQEKMRAAAGAGGRKTANIERLVSYWSQNFTGGIAAHARTRSSSTRELTETGLAASEIQSLTLRDLIADLVDTSQLDNNTKHIIDEFLAQRSSLFIKSAATQRLYGVAESSLNLATASRLAHSDESCHAVNQACERLTQDDVYASNWFHQQLSQILSQEVVGLDSDLELSAGGHPRGC